MRGLIVAAGQGTRLRELAPIKPLALVDGNPLIVHVIESSLAAGVDEFVVVTGYEAEQLEAFLAAYAARRGVRLEFIRNPDWMGRNGLSVVAAADSLGDRFTLTMADHLFDPAIMRGLIADAPADAGLVLAVDRRLQNPLVDLDDVTCVEAAADGRIRRIGKGLERYNAFDTGIFLASQELIAAIRGNVAGGGGGSISEGVQALADAGRAMTFDIGHRFWLDVDDAAAMRQAESVDLSRPGLAAGEPVFDHARPG